MLIKINRSKEIRDKLRESKGPTYLDNEDEYKRIVDSLNKQMRKVKRQFRLKNAKSIQSARKTFLTT